MTFTQSSMIVNKFFLPFNLVLWSSISLVFLWTPLELTLFSFFCFYLVSFIHKLIFAKISLSLVEIDIFFSLLLQFGLTRRWGFWNYFFYFSFYQSDFLFLFTFSWRLFISSKASFLCLFIKISIGHPIYEHDQNFCMNLENNIFVSSLSFPGLM